MANDLEQKIIQQLEYYFGDINLPRDKFLQEKIKEDEGWIALDVLLTFKRLASLSTDQEVIANAIEKSDKKLVLVSEDKKKLRRSPELPIPEYNDERKKELQARTAYAKGFPLDETLDPIIEFLKPHGPITCCQQRTYVNKPTKEHKFKGSCFIIFDDVETCKKFIEAEGIQYKEKDLVRKWQKDYFEDKAAEYKKRKETDKAERDAYKVPNEKKPKDMPKGAVFFFDGIAEGKQLTFEQIKAKVKEIGDIETAFVDFRKGDQQGHVRLPGENSAVDFHKKLEEGKMKIDEIELSVKVLEGEEEEAYLKKTQEELKNKFNKKGKFSRKRKGNFGNGGGSKGKRSRD